MGFLRKLFGGGQKGQGMTAQIISQLSTDLNLTTDQLTGIRNAFHHFKEARKSIKASDGDDSRTEMKKERQQLKDTILGLLNEEQKQKFLANMDKYREFFQK